jgi:hypothetical protein
MPMPHLAWFAHPGRSRLFVRIKGAVWAFAAKNPGMAKPWTFDQFDQQSETFYKAQARLVLRPRSKASRNCLRQAGDLPDKP